MKERAYLMKKRLSLLLAALFVASTMAAAPVYGDGKKDDEKDKDKKVCVKHYTSSKKNPYVYIWISESGWENGHKKHGDKKVDDKYCDKKDDDKKDDDKKDKNKKDKDDKDDKEDKDKKHYKK